jgi:RNA polymerase sigma factor (TIGR02999 family)
MASNTGLDDSAPGTTQLLIDWGRGDLAAREGMVPLVYDELRRLAAAYLHRERSDHTLQPTALVHEAYLRLIDQRSVDWRNRAQFVGLAAVMMRRILVNHARDRAAGKRGGGATRVTLTDESAVRSPDFDLLALHDAIDRLAVHDPRKAQLVELKFFGGLTTEEMSEVLHVSSATIERDWSFARAWLYEALRHES